jgi:phospholipase C
MVGIGRRRFLGSSAAAITLAAAALLPTELQRVLASTNTGVGSLADVKHVVLMMMENRSFDHYFGTLHGVRGFADPSPARLDASGRSVFHQPFPANPDGYVLPFRLDSTRTSAQAIRSLNHSWEAEHGYWAGGRMDGFLTYQARHSVVGLLGKAAAGASRREYAMGYFTREDLPFHYALAENFTLCDNYFCSVMGSTWPNRLMWMTGTIDPLGRSGGPIKDTGDKLAKAGRLTWTTYPERLERAGVSWRAYDEHRGSGLNPLHQFGQFRTAPKGSPLRLKGVTQVAPDAFEQDVAAGRLPTVSWVFPKSSDSEHPKHHPADGARAIARKLAALAAHPEVWARTVFILNYDENDGLFDHVSPPAPSPDTAGEFVGADHVGPGFRVPCIVVSPWTTGGWVSSELLDHTSILRLLEHVTGVAEPNISPWRRATFGDLRNTLRFAASPDTSTAALSRLPDAKRIAERVDLALRDGRLPAPEVPAPQRMPPEVDRRRPDPA